MIIQAPMLAAIESGTQDLEHGIGFRVKGFGWLEEISDNRTQHR